MKMTKSSSKPVELGKIPTTVGLRLELPKIDPELLADPSRFDEVIEKKMTGVEQVEGSVTDALKWLAEVMVWLTLCQPSPDDPEDIKKKKAMRLRIARQEVAPNQRKVEEYLKSCLCADEQIYRMSAAISYLNYQFGQEFSTHEEAEGMLKDLEEKKLLVKAGNGPIMIGYQRYAVSSDFGLESEDIAQVQNAVAKFARSYLQLTRQQRQEKTGEIRQEATLTFEQFVKGIQGKFLLEIPAENYIQDGQERWRGGGNLFVQIQGKDVLPLEGIGSIQNMVTNMADMNVRLPHYTLQWELPPGAGKGFQKLKEGVMNTRNMSDEDAETYVRKMQSFWHLLIRGMDVRIREEEMNKKRAFFAQNATITPQEFFGLEGQALCEGTAFLEFEGAFKYRGETIYNLLLLIERSRDETGVTFVEVLDAPEHIEELLGELGKKKLQEGENFEMLTPELQRILRAIRSKTDMKVELAKELA